MVFYEAATGEEEGEEGRRRRPVIAATENVGLHPMAI